MRPLVILPVYNDSDILVPVLEHLERQGCDVYLIDNWSTDGLPVLADELWPDKRPPYFDWTGLLYKMEEVALEHGQGRWVIQHDADEIRRAPISWGEISLSEGLDRAYLLGYNAVQFACKTFVPVDNDWVKGSNPEVYFKHYKPEHVDHRISHVKAWFQGVEKVDLHTNAGHRVVFPGINICPTKFVLKHYPIRSQEHGEQKVLKERFPRYKPEERAKEWHVQYNEYVADSVHNFLKDPKDLYLDQSPVSIVTLTRFPEIFEQLANTIDRFEPGARKIVVTSGGAKINRPGWEVIEGHEPFIFARNLNLGIAAAGSDDVLCVNDDVQLTGPILNELSDIAYKTRAGVVSPQIQGGIGNHKAKVSYQLQGKFEFTTDYIPFVCAFLRRDVLRDIGYLDESFDGYGGDDVEFGLRAMKHGYPMVVSKVKVKHGFEEHKCSASFLRVMNGIEQLRSAHKMLFKLSQKSPEAEKVVNKILSVIA